MNTKIGQFPATNPNPVLSVKKDGIVLYSNEVGEPLLHEWGVEVGEKLPSFIGEFVQRVISRNSPEKMEAKVGHKVYLITFHPSPEEKCVNIYGFDISDHKELERKLQEAYENLQVQSEELQVQSEELQAQSEELQVQYEELQIQSEEVRKAYESLQESENKFRTLTENSPDLIARFDRENRHTYANSATAELYSCSQEEIIGKTHTELKENPELVKFWERHYENVFTTGKPETMEFQCTSPQGKEYYFNTRIVPEFVNTEVTSVLAISRDITERKKSEETIQILANIVESSNDAIGTISLDGVITNWNKGAEQVYGYSAEEVLGKPISVLSPPNLSKETQNLSEKIKQGEKISRYETLRLRKDKKIIYVSISLSPVFDSHGKLTFVSFISRDITERKEAEETLVNIENARKKEIHHRIKNNLQVISSLLDLQAYKFENRKDINYTEVMEAFRESQDRVISMALIHEELHKCGGFEKLNFSQYIKELAGNLFMIYKFGNNIVSLNMDLAENLFFDMDTAVPLGIIVNELISNSLKHAFPGRNKGEVLIKLREEESEECIKSINKDCKNTSFALTVSDNGIGIPENFEIEDLDSLGLQLVTTLVEQLDGDLELKRNNGTEFTIKFSVCEINNQAPAPRLFE
jgi:PAS domain S-box-containing protein